MSTSHPIERSASAPVNSSARGIVRFLYTHNPFYVISAWFMFTGLRISFDPQAGALNTTALMLSLAAYTLLLAGTAWLLIRLGQVWQDVRGLLLLIVMMFMAISVVIDDILVVHVERGAICYALGLLFSVGLSELLLWSLGIRLPALYRFPYYMLLALFFLYPMALGVHLVANASPWLPWGLFAFPTVAGILALSLLPATGRGPQYVRDNGTPWRWPLFPWTLFAFLAGGVCLRAYYLCVSLHHIGGTNTIFGFYFLVPLLMAIGILILEAGLATGNRRVQKFALLVPLACLIGVAIPYDGGVIYQRFLAMFQYALGGSPLFFTLCGAILFYALAVARRVPLADVALAGSLAALSVVSPRSIDLFDGLELRGNPLLLAAAVLLLWGLWKWDSRRTLAGAICLVAALSVELRHTWFLAYEGFLPLNLLLVAAFCIGIWFDDPLGRLLKQFAALAMIAAGLAVMLLETSPGSNLPLILTSGYPFVVAIWAGVYGYRWRDPLYQFAASCNLTVALSAAATAGYQALRPRVPGINKILCGLVFFAFAVAISLYKAGQFRRPLRSPSLPSFPPSGESGHG